MPASFQDLVTQYEAPEKVPHEELYDLLMRIKPDLINRSALVSPKMDEKGEATGELDYIGFRQIEESPIGLEVRRRCHQDLFWLSRYFLWETNPESRGLSIICRKCEKEEHAYRTCTHNNKITLHTHGPICDLFVKKNAQLHLADQDDVCKQRMLLYPRGSMKSTIDVADVVQWILVLPHVRILFLTAAKELAVGFCDDLKGHFVEKLYTKSLMNLFFHDWCLPEKEITKMSMYEFDCPVWTKQGMFRREHTVMANSIESTLSGFHFDIIKADDAVSTKNSENQDQCAKVIKNFYINIKTLMAYGYLDLIGTRYHDMDLYGEYLEKNAAPSDPNVTRDENKSRCWTYSENQETHFKALVGTGWAMKPEWDAKLEKGEIKESQVPEDGYWIMFPENLPYKKLKLERAKNEASFESQIQQNPRSRSVAVFTRPMLLRATLPVNQLPVNGPKVITWDFAFSPKKGRDYTTAAVGQYNDKGQLFIVDILRERFHKRGTELAQAVVKLAKIHSPVIVAIEDAAGSRYLEGSIIMEAQRTQNAALTALLGRIDWFTPDNQKDAKPMRMASMAPWITNNQLFFSAALPHLEILYDEFERCLTSHHHDDIPDVISHQLRYVPRVNLLIQRKEIQTYSSAEAAYRLLYEEDYKQPGRGFVYDPVTNAWVDGEPLSHPIAPVIDAGLPAEVPAAGLDPIFGSGIRG